MKIAAHAQKAARKIKIARKESAKCASQQLFYLLQILFEKLRLARILRDECRIEARHEADAALVKDRAVQRVHTRQIAVSQHDFTAELP